MAAASGHGTHTVANAAISWKQASTDRIVYGYADADGLETVAAWDCAPHCPARRLSDGDEARFFFQADWSHEVAEQLAAADPVRYQAKASRKERDAGLDGFPLGKGPEIGVRTIEPGKQVGHSGPRRNIHPTCKPIDLIRWLATLLLPPAEYAPRRVLVPFAGSGSEMIGCGLAGWDEIVGVELMPEYAEIAEARLAHWLNPEQPFLL